MKNVVIAVSLLLAPGLAAADIKVHQSGGVEGAASGAPALVTFDSVDRIVVRQVTSEAQATFTSNTGAMGGAYGDTSAALCITPCKLELPAGFYRIRFGDYNPMNGNKAIDFNLKPGESAYRVTPFRGGKFIGGALLVIFGGTAAIVGGSLGIIQSENSTPMFAMAGAGAVGAIIGGVMMVGARATAEPIR